MYKSRKGKIEKFDAIDGTMHWSWDCSNFTDDDYCEYSIESELTLNRDESIIYYGDIFGRITSIRVGLKSSSPTNFPTFSPTSTPSVTPSLAPSGTPSITPSRYPTTSPSITPSIFPSTQRQPTTTVVISDATSSADYRYHLLSYSISTLVISTAIAFYI